MYEKMVGGPIREIHIDKMKVLLRNGMHVKRMFLVPGESHEQGQALSLDFGNIEDLEITYDSSGFESVNFHDIFDMEGQLSALITKPSLRPGRVWVRLPGYYSIETVSKRFPSLFPLGSADGEVTASRFVIHSFTLVPHSQEGPKSVDHSWTRLSSQWSVTFLVCSYFRPFWLIRSSALRSLYRLTPQLEKLTLMTTPSYHSDEGANEMEQEQEIFECSNYNIVSLRYKIVLTLCLMNY
jgi:hypothetical protein